MFVCVKGFSGQEIMFRVYVVLKTECLFVCLLVFILLDCDYSLLILWKCFGLFELVGHDRG